MDLNKIIIIQRLFRKKLLYKEKDSMTIQLCNKLLDKYVKYTEVFDYINNLISAKKCRLPNFPSEISETLVKYAFRKHYKICPTWITKSGDLEVDIYNYNKLRLEVKCFSSKGPSSFGPEEKWDKLYFVDARNYKRKTFIIYEISLSNESSKWKSIKINKTQTYEEQCEQSRRPRISYDNLINQIDDKYIKTIFSGHILDLF